MVYDTKYIPPVVEIIVADCRFFSVYVVGIDTQYGQVFGVDLLPHSYPTYTHP